MWHARVGIVPQPARQEEQEIQQNERSDRSQRHQGITMQDLKKQTALRLAQEQHRRRAFYGFYQQRRETPYETVEGEGRIYNGENGGDASFQGPPVCGAQAAGDELQSDGPSQAHPAVSETAGPIWNQSNGDAPVSSYMGEEHYDQNIQYSEHYLPHKDVDVIESKDHMGAPASLSYQQNGRLQNAGQSVPNLQNFGDVQQQQPSHPTPKKKGPLGRIFSSDNSRQQYSSNGQGQNAGRHGGNSKQRNKLPHGLTVNELKEMTKARLQAEASQERDGSETNAPAAAALPEPPSSYGQQFIQGGQNSIDMRMQQQTPLPFARNSGHHPRGESLPTSMSMPSMYPMHNQGSFAAGNRNGPMGQQVQSTNANPWYQQSNDASWQDALDSQSVASLNTLGSDCLGSESAFSASMTSFPLDESSSHAQNVPTRVRSFSGTLAAGSVVESQWTDPSPSSVNVSAAYYDSGGANRRRACTLSPSGLGHLHEDRPLYLNAREGEELSIPLFDAAPAQNLPARVSSMTRSSSPSRGSSPIGFGVRPSVRASGSFGDPYFQSHSTLTSSSTSNSSFGLRQRSSSDFNPSVRPRHHDIPHSFLDGLLGDSTIDVSQSASRKSESGFSSVFKGTVPGEAPARMGGSFFHSEEIAFSSASSGGFVSAVSSGSELQHTQWASHTQTPPPGFPSSVDRDDETYALGEELSSILKLSGAEESDNHFVSRIDPEVNSKDRLMPAPSESSFSQCTQSRISNSNTCASGEGSENVRTPPPKGGRRSKRRERGQRKNKDP